MSTYLPLPPVPLTAVTIDPSGVNGSNYTNAFTSSVLGGLNMPFIELYHATVTGAPGGASARIVTQGQEWGFTAPGVGGGSEYAPANGMLLQPGQEIYFYWSTGTGGAPKVTLWFRYDLDVPANADTANLP